jgi:hypothetical protein
MIVALLIIIILILLFGAAAVKSATARIAAFAAIVVVGGIAMGLVKDALGQSGLIIVLIGAPIALILLASAAIWFEGWYRDGRGRVSERNQARKTAATKAARSARLEEIWLAMTDKVEQFSPTAQARARHLYEVGDVRGLRGFCLAEFRRLERRGSKRKD